MKITRTYILSWKYFFADLIRILRLLTPARIGNWILLEGSYHLSRLTGKIHHFGMPTAFSVESSALCNLKCPECITGSDQLIRPKGLLNMELFRSIIEQTRKKSLWIQLHFQGEPFLNPLLPDMITFTTQNKMYSSISTNGHFLTERNAEKIIEAGLSRIIISLDGISQEVYETYRINGNFLQITDGIRTLARIRQEKKVNHPLIIIQFLVFSHNQHQMKQARKLAKYLGADVFCVKIPQILHPSRPGKVLPAGGKWSRYSSNKQQLSHSSCHLMWTSPVITWDGLLLPCCFDKNATYSFGNLNQSTFSEIWKGEKARQWRKKIFNSLSSPDICLNCIK